MKDYELLIVNTKLLHFAHRTDVQTAEIEMRRAYEPKLYYS